MFLKTSIVVIQIFSSFILVGLILLQHGKGADIGATFSNSSFDSLFGATGSANFLSRTTAVFAIVFFTSTLTLTYLSSHKSQLSTSVVPNTQKNIPTNTVTTYISTPAVNSSVSRKNLPK
ncbi:MAG: preprotein translocase subunit SecG [Burkholderia sp.]|nr:preprotein translocase subunit SecG [Burkholderia sp.]